MGGFHRLCYKKGMQSVETASKGAVVADLAQRGVTLERRLMHWLNEN